ncbi:MAG: divalent-cation tolerance protein CutA [Rickettsiales bacterium]|jgi:periplasmic divalent cation tolerance protein|nr:divalent-cation tolerance protein CutA [Rickettsiales bacterium]
MAEPILIYVTTPSLEIAEQMALALVEEKRAACANILGEIRAIYRFEGALENTSETALLLKTTKAQEAAVIARIKALHPYNNPAILTLPVLGGSPEFLAWIQAATS